MRYIMHTFAGHILATPVIFNKLVVKDSRRRRMHTFMYPPYQTQGFELPSFCTMFMHSIQTFILIEWFARFIHMHQASYIRNRQLAYHKSSWTDIQYFKHVLSCVGWLVW